MSILLFDGGCFVAGPVSEAAARLLLPNVCGRCVHFTCIATREIVWKSNGDRECVEGGRFQTDGGFKKNCIAKEFCNLPPNVIFNHYGENKLVTEYKDKDRSVAKCEGKDQ